MFRSRIGADADDPVVSVSIRRAAETIALSEDLRARALRGESISPDDVDRYARRQLDLLGRYSQAVKPGGRMVYSTCSLFQAENEGVVEAFLAGDAAFSGIDASSGVPWEVERGPHGSATLLPRRNPTDGFFIAVLERRK